MNKPDPRWIAISLQESLINEEGIMYGLIKRFGRDHHLVIHSRKKCDTLAYLHKEQLAELKRLGLLDEKRGCVIWRDGEDKYEV